MFVKWPEAKAANGALSRRPSATNGSAKDGRLQRMVMRPGSHESDDEFDLILFSLTELRRATAE
jgi:hypothetical protein